MRIRRRGTTLVEVLIGAGIGALVLGAGISLMLGLARAEVSTDRAADAVTAAARVAELLRRDASGVPEAADVEFAIWGSGWELLLFTVDGVGNGVEVRYRFDPETAILERMASDGSLRRIHLGEDSGRRGRASG